jgi:hypothetical protein
MIDLPPSLSEHEQVESLAYRLYEDEENRKAEPTNTGLARSNLFTPNA